MNVVSLFAGVGGFDLALERMGHTTMAYSEVDPWACSVMAVRFPNAVSLGDITKIDWSQLERPDIVCGGFPCQPHSLAGARQGAADARDLWPECVRALRDLRPRLALFENVRGLLTSGGGGVFNRCLSDLAALGYDAEWQVLSAADVGAPHRRERVWIVAHRKRDRRQGSEPTGAASGAIGGSGTLAHRDSGGCEQFGFEEYTGEQGASGDVTHGCDSDGGRQGPRWPTPRTEDGESTGLSRARRAAGVRDNLPSVMRYGWRTPSDPTKRSGSQPEDKRREGGHTVNLEDQVTGKLNPDWVETLMGYPIGWTDPAVPNEALVYPPSFPAPPGPQYDWEPPRITTRKAGRRKRLRCLGNAIVPACLAAVGLALGSGPAADTSRSGLA